VLYAQFLVVSLQYCVLIAIETLLVAGLTPHSFLSWSHFLVSTVEESHPGPAAPPSPAPALDELQKLVLVINDLPEQNFSVKGPHGP
jgi:hypothetical protein